MKIKDQSSSSSSFFLLNGIMPKNTSTNKSAKTGFPVALVESHDCYLL